MAHLHAGRSAARNEVRHGVKVFARGVGLVIDGPVRLVSQTFANRNDERTALLS